MKAERLLRRYKGSYSVEGPPINLGKPLRILKRKIKKYLKKKKGRG